MIGKKLLCLSLAVLMLCGVLAGCGGGKEPAGPAGTSTGSVESSKATDGKTSEQTADPGSSLPSYNRAAQDLDRYELDVLHVEPDLWNMHTDLAPVNYTGDVISNAIYSRNEYVEEQYNCFITEHNGITFYSMSGQIATLVLSGECMYDAAYSEGSSVNELVSQSLVENLYSFSALQLDESWWSQIVNRESTLGTGKYRTLFFTQSNLSLPAFDLTWCVYFNKAMHYSYQLDDLYEMAREKTWTIGQLYSTAKSIATMNGDETFTYSADGKAIYGMTTYWNGAKAMLIGGGIRFTGRNEDDDLVVAKFGEDYTNLCDALALLFGESGTFTFGGPSSDGSTTGNASDYTKIFNANRSLFLGAEVKASVSALKDFPYEFGILPMPAMNEGDEYRSWVNYLAPVLVLPKQTEDPEKATILLDALSYYSDRDVLPIYYDKVLRGRGAKDEDSVDMLEIINQTRCFDASIAYGWSRQFVEVVAKLVFQGNGPAAGVQPESYTEMIQTNIENTFNAVFGD